MGWLRVVLAMPAHLRGLDPVRRRRCAVARAWGGGLRRLACWEVAQARQERRFAHMADQIPVIDLRAALGEHAPDGLPDAVRSAAALVGAVQVINHGVPEDVIADYGRRAGRLLGLPRAENAGLARPGGAPYLGVPRAPEAVDAPC